MSATSEEAWLFGDGDDVIPPYVIQTYLANWLAYSFPDSGAVEPSDVQVIKMFMVPWTDATSGGIMEIEVLATTMSGLSISTRGNFDYNRLMPILRDLKAELT